MQLLISIITVFGLGFFFCWRYVSSSRLGNILFKSSVTIRRLTLWKFLGLGGSFNSELHRVNQVFIPDSLLGFGQDRRGV